MQITPLHDGWKFTEQEPGTTLSEIDLESGRWLPIDIPGDVNDVLVKTGRLPNPHFGTNGRECYWVTSREWWFRLDFQAQRLDSEEKADLCLDGIDGHADVFLNGECLGRVENAFRPRRFDVKDRIIPDSANVLLLRFLAIDEVLGGPRQDDLAGWRGLRARMRKPQFSFGWDWSLPLPSLGVMGGIWLEHYGPRLLEVSVQPRLSGRLDFKFRVNSVAREVPYELRLKVQGHGNEIENTIVRSARAYSHTSIQLENPKLWWPNGMGEQALYDYEVLLVVAGKVCDQRQGKAGIRESTILEEPFTEEAGPGISFWLEVNGERVFCKGGNWIPLKLWPSTVSDEQYHFYLEKASEANFNMLRIWGGGIYEKDLFYQLCDELGIMVWQDFMFASTGYPVDPLRGEIMAEAEHQVRRLRNHPSIVLWCGCNEDCYSWGQGKAAIDKMADTGVYSEPSEGFKVDRLRDDPQIYSMILRGTVGRLGLGVPYVESSPQSYEDAGNFPESGNSHLSCWKHSLLSAGDYPERFRDHFEQVCSFDSEFCIQGPCSVKTFEKFMPVQHLWPPDDVWTYYIQRGHANLPHHEQTMKIAGALFGKIDSLQKFVKYGQATHAEQMRAEFESARRDRPNNGGTMMWMFNDCRPTSNWSIIDYFRFPKPSYYAAKRACATLLPIVFERANRVEFFFSNDGASSGEVELTFGQKHLDDTLVWEKTVRVAFGPVQTVRFHAVERSSLELSPGDFLSIDAVLDGKRLPYATYFPGLWRDVSWPVPQIQLEKKAQKEIGSGWILSFRVKTDKYARFVHLKELKEAADNQQAWFDDNFFDLCPGHARTVQVFAQSALGAEDLTVGHWHTDWP